MRLAGGQKVEFNAIRKPGGGVRMLTRLLKGKEEHEKSGVMVALKKNTSRLRNMQNLLFILPSVMLKLRSLVLSMTIVIGIAFSRLQKR